MPASELAAMAFRQLSRILSDPEATVENKMQLLEIIRTNSPETGREADHCLFERIAQLEKGLRDTKASQEELRQLLAKLTATPWYPAVFRRYVATPQGRRAEVAVGNARRVIEISDDVGPDSLRNGDEVHVSQEHNAVMARSPGGVPQFGELASFQRRTPDGRFVLKRHGDDEVIVDACDALSDAALEEGDPVRWQRDSWMAFEKLPKPEQGRQFLLEDVPDVDADQVGGQTGNLQRLLDALTAALLDPDKADAYQIGKKRSLLMVGPPGCGKTLMARVAAARLARMSGRRCRFAVVKPGEWEEEWVGSTQRNIRNCFAALRRAARDALAILFLDEVESIGRVRGHAVGHHSDKFLNALLAELDGFADRSNVAIVAATNRKDLIDPALLQRLGDQEIAVGRPDMRGARDIFAIHLPASLPFSDNSVTAAQTREEMIDTAVSRFYSPNADNALCVLRFRDGKSRTVAAGELASGRCFEQICRAARAAAYLRDVRGGEPGLTVVDIEAAVSDAMGQLASMLTVRNVRAYLDDLPQDVDVVSVDPVVRRIVRPHRYLNVA